MARMINDIVAGRPLVSGTKDMTVRAASKLMAAKHVSALVILDGKRIAGIFTERDAISKVLADGLNPDKTPISEVMASEPQTVRAAMPVAFALHMMVEGGFRHVPVVDDNGEAIGMVSARDALGEDLVRLEREMERRDVLENPLS
ncbi:MAG: CBS domain-containing protein [Betaproteobacteria bacterium]